MSYDYFMHGLALSSEIALFEPSVDSDGAPDLTVVIGESRTFEFQPEERVLMHVRGGHVVYEAKPLGDRWIVRVPGLASFDVGSGDIVTHPHPELAEPAILPLLLAGTGLAFFLMIHGEFCLHASAVGVDGVCVAFAGSSGRGKTTLAALACAAGFSLFGDDLLRIRIDGDAACAFRGSSEIRLRTSAEGLADLIAGDRRVTIDERTSVRPARSEHEILPIAAIVLPRPDRETPDVRVRRLRPSEAFSALAECPRLLGWTHPDTLTMEFEHLVRLSTDVPVIEAFVPWGSDLDPGVAEITIRESLNASLERA